ATLGAVHVLPGRMTIERVARLVESDVLRQCHGEILFRYRHDAACAAVYDGDRTTPVALPRNSPIAQPIVHLPLRDRTIAARFSFKPLGHFFLGLLDRHPV